MQKPTWLSQKTTLAGITAIIAALSGWATGELQMAAALQIIATAAIGIFLRQGVAKANDNMQKVARTRVRVRRKATKDAENREAT